jgi:hypothetical protein
LPSADGLIMQIRDLLDFGDVGVWELVWALNSSHPDARLLDKIKVAKRAATLLISQDWDLWRGVWPEGPIAPLTQEEKVRLSEEDAAWFDPESAELLVWLRQLT